MAPRNFSEDGAVGAESGGNFGTTNSTGGTSTTTATPPQQQFGNTGFETFSPNGYNGPAGGAIGLSFKDGGAIPDSDTDDDDAEDGGDNPTGASLQNSINAAMASVQSALSYGRQLHGLGGGQQEAARMPSVPGSQSESGVPRDRPAPGPLPPTSNPFGKRADAGDGAIDDSDDDTGKSVIPSQPFSETPKPQPMPGPLPPTSNPFGKRADSGAIDDSDEEA